MDDLRHWAGMVVMADVGGHASHYVGYDQVWAASLGWGPRAACGRVIAPAALVAPLPLLCTDCAAARELALAATRRPYRFPRLRRTP